MRCEHGLAPRVCHLAECRSRVLTARESEVVAIVAEGRTNREVAARLGISESVVKRHVRFALWKLGLDNRTELAVWWTLREAAA